MIFTVTAIKQVKQIKKSRFPKCEDVRCLGYTTNLFSTTIAIKTLANHGRFIIVEEIPEGFFKYTPNRYVYEWSTETNSYRQIDEPKIFNSITNFAMG